MCIHSLLCPEEEHPDTTYKHISPATFRPEHRVLPKRNVQDMFKGPATCTIITKSDRPAMMYVPRKRMVVPCRMDHLPEETHTSIRQ